MRLIVQRVDRVEDFCWVTTDSEILYAITVEGRHAVNGPWKFAPIPWPPRATFVALPSGGLYRTRARNLKQLLEVLPPKFARVNSGVAVNMDRVRFVLRGEGPLLVGFEQENSGGARPGLWVEIAQCHNARVLDALDGLRPAAPRLDGLTLNGEGMAEAGDFSPAHGGPSASGIFDDYEWWED